MVVNHWRYHHYDCYKNETDVYGAQILVLSSGQTGMFSHYGERHSAWFVDAIRG